MNSVILVLCAVAVVTIAAYELILVVKAVSRGRNRLTGSPE